MIPASQDASDAQSRAGLKIKQRRPMPVCPVTVLPFLTREGAFVPVSQIVPEQALEEQGSPAPDRGISRLFPFPADLPRDES